MNTNKRTLAAVIAGFAMGTVTASAAFVAGAKGPEAPVAALAVQPAAPTFHEQYVLKASPNEAPVYEY